MLGEERVLFSLLSTVPLSTQHCSTQHSLSAASPQRAARRGSGGLAVEQHGGAIDQDVPDAFGQGTPVGVGGAVDDGRRVEQDDIGGEAGPQEAAVGQAEAAGGVRGKV